MNSEKLMEAIGCAGGRYVEELIELMDNKKIPAAFHTADLRARCWPQC